MRRGLKTPLLIGDMPFGSYEASNEQAIENAQRFVKEAGCDAVKLERGGPSVDRARAIIRAGIPVMGHVGLTPQTATRSAASRPRAGPPRRRRKLAEDALALQSVGCFAIVFEAIPAAVTEALMPSARGARDRDRRRPGDRRPGARLPRPARHLRRATSRGSSSATPTCARQMVDGRARPTPRTSAPARFPDEEHTYSIDPEELEEFKRYLDEESLAGTDTPWDW